MHAWVKIALVTELTGASGVSDGFTSGYIERDSPVPGRSPAWVVVSRTSSALVQVVASAAHRLPATRVRIWVIAASSQPGQVELVLPVRLVPQRRLAAAHRRQRRVSRADPPLLPCVVRVEHPAVRGPAVLALLAVHRIVGQVDVVVAPVRLRRQRA